MRPDSVTFSKEWLSPTMRSYTNTLLLLVLGSLAALASAYIAEYGFGLKPCHLCLYQRIPYALIIVFCGVGLAVRRYPSVIKLLLFLSLLSLLAGAGLASYHAGVEQGIFQGLEGCSGNIPEGTLTIEQLREQILQATEAARCDKPAFVLFGISMAGWNAVYSLGLFVLSLFSLRRKGKRR